MMRKVSNKAPTCLKSALNQLTLCLEFANISVVTKSSADAFPSSLRLKRSVVKTTIGRDELEEGATVCI